jgi:hypothetical protein
MQQPVTIDSGKEGTGIVSHNCCTSLNTVTTVHEEQVAAFCGESSWLMRKVQKHMHVNEKLHDRAQGWEIRLCHKYSLTRAIEAKVTDPIDSTIIVTGQKAQRRIIH